MVYIVFIDVYVGMWGDGCDVDEERFVWIGNSVVEEVKCFFWDKGLCIDVIVSNGGFMVVLVLWGYVGICEWVE